MSIKKTGKNKKTPPGSEKKKISVLPAKKTDIKSKAKSTRASLKKKAARKKSSVPPIVALGASAGGLDAFTEFFSSMPEKNGMAFVVIAHLDPSHVSMLPELLQKSTKMNVQKVVDGIKVEADSVYIIPPNKSMAILNGALLLMDREQFFGSRLPIDSFFRSLAKDQGSNAVCIILSGTGSDGTLGLKEIKGEMGMVMAQDEKSAKYAGMPRSAIETGLVDYILPPKKMPVQLIKYINHPLDAHRKLTVPIEIKAPTDLQKIMVLLRTHTSHDFSVYKQNTICRRIERRMNIHQFKKTEDYVCYLQKSPKENDVLFKELLIGVTNFFRDPDSFEALAKKILPAMISNKPADHIMRIWVPGCSSGEEIYSLAITINEVMEKNGSYVKVQIFGTDIDPDAIAIARAGLYPRSISDDVSPCRLKRYFTKEDSMYRINKNIREMVIFAEQNIIKDPPFTKLDLISCRNLLIYLNAEVQKKIMPLFGYSLKKEGILMLGSSETVGSFTDLFRPVDKKWKIYRVNKSSDLNTTPIVFPLELPRPSEVIADTENKYEENPDMDIAGYIEKRLLKNYAPAAVVINKKAEAVYISGRTGKYLEPAAGEVSWNIIDMAREGLKHEISRGIRKAATLGKKVRYENLLVETDGKVNAINLIISPINDSKALKGLFLLTFEDLPAPPEKIKATVKGKTSASSEKDRHIDVLEQELKYLKENLQTVIEEQEISNEELKSSNEELQSTNEELQSTNEEMETSKEELQSLNEELTTVNSELKRRIEELTSTGNDMKNLLDSTEIAVIFLDSGLCVRRFTPKATDIVNLVLTDAGRPLAHIVLKVKYDKLIADAEKVLNNLIPIKKEIQSKTGCWYECKIIPYRTIDNVIDGVVVLFNDITIVKKAKEEADKLAKFPQENPNPVMRVTDSGHILYANSVSSEILKSWNADIGDKLSDKWQKLISATIKSRKKYLSKEEINGHLYSFEIVPVKGAGYVNIYGSDITRLEKLKAEIKLSEIKDSSRKND